MKKNHNKNGATFTLTNSEKKSILETYNVLEKLLTAFDNSLDEFEPQEGKVFRIRINGDEVLPFDELEDLAITMENMITMENVSLSLEDEDDCD